MSSIPQEELDTYVGKEYEVDFTRRDLEKQFPSHEVFVSKLGALAIANFRPDRIRVWLDEDSKVVKIVTG